MTSRTESSSRKLQQADQQQQNKRKSDRDISIVLLGSGGVGKSCLTIQYVRGVFVKDYHPTIEDIYTKPVEIDGIVSTLTVVDTAGQDSFEGMREHYMKSGDAFIFTYSITDSNSLPYARQLYAQLRRIRSTKTSQQQQGQLFPVCFLVGNKSDLGTTSQREVTPDEGLHFATSAGIKHFQETSAINSETVDSLFHDVIRQVRRNRGLTNNGNGNSSGDMGERQRSINPLDFVGGAHAHLPPPSSVSTIESNETHPHHEEGGEGLSELKPRSTTTTLDSSMPRDTQGVSNEGETSTIRSGKRKKNKDNGRKKKWYEEIGCTML